MAETTGATTAVGRWVIDRACHDAATLSLGAFGLGVAVNVSARQLDRAVLAEEVRSGLRHSGLDPARLTLELTESALMEDEDSARVTLSGLAGSGVRIAIDDFGTGFSPLLYLRRFPVNALKLDREFVSGVTKNGGDRAICASVVGLAHAVGATSIAEGVESCDQFAALRALGCERGQGYLWSRPVPLAELPAALQAAGRVPLPEVAPA